jgi:hypothetical protein
VKGVRKVHLGSEVPSEFGIDAMARLRRGDVAGAGKIIEVARRIHAPKGAIGKLLDKASDAESLKLAAAALTLDSVSDHAAEAFDALEKALGGEKKEKRREVLRAVLAGADIRHERGAKLLELADAFAESEDEESADFARYKALYMLGRYDEASTFAQKVAAKTHESSEWLFNASWSAAKTGKFDVASGLLEKLLAKKGDDAAALNNLAWFSLFTKVDDEAIARAERANLITKNQSDSELGTLACLYAHVGRVDDALRTVQLMMNIENDFSNGHASRWYVMGRISEGLGLDEEARGYYGRVENDPENPNDDIAALAKGRLAALGKGNVIEPIAGSSHASPPAKKVAVAKKKTKH